MSGKREEERNEKVIRGLLKLPPNRRCINCNGLGPQYVCTNFWTFVCTACSGIHREFTHRVKSVSMAKFTSQEVEALQNGGNQRARELLLKDWDMQNMKLPDSSYPDRIREFIKNVYVEKKYAVGTSDKPPIDPQGLKSHEEHRRASSYHSFSQSPPYEHQYEDRRYGKPRIMLSRKPGSDNGHYEGNISSILSPGRNREQVYEDRFANESSSSRISDYSISSAGDPFKSGGQSPSMRSNSSSQQKSASLGSFGSFDSNTVYPKSTKFCALSDVMFEPEHGSISQHPSNSTIVSQKTSTPQNAAINDIFSLQFSQPQDMKTSVDLFADFNNQPSCTFPSENKPSPIPISGNEGWAMFDFVHKVEPDPEAKKDLASVISPGIEESVGINDGFSSKKDTSQLFSAQNTVAYGKLAPSTDQWHTGFSGIQNAPESSIPVWNAFDDSFEKNSQALKANSPQGHVLVNEPGPSFFGGQHTDAGHVEIPKAPSTQEWKSSNPFDLSYDLDAGSSNMFLDMSSLQAALPKPQLPNAFLEGLSEPWFPQNSASTFSPSIPQAASPYIGGQVPSSHLPNIPSQGSAASGNPFA